MYVATLAFHFFLSLNTANVQNSKIFQCFPFSFTQLGEILPSVRNK